MMTSAVAALVMLAQSTGAGTQELHWPLVPGPLFSISGIDANGAASLMHAKIRAQIGTEAIGQPKMFAHGGAARLDVPTNTAPWKTLEACFTTTTDGPVLSVGGVSFAIRGGFLVFEKGTISSKVAPVSSSDLTDLQVVRRMNETRVYLNGTRIPRLFALDDAVYPIEVGVDPWRGTVLGVAAYTRALTVDEVYANNHAVREMSKVLFADTPKVTIEAELTAMTPVPELERIRPYRSALLAEEYKVVRIVSGRMSAIKPGMKIRVFRYGIKSGEKTAIKDAKIGDHATMLVQTYDSDPKFSREFQVDTLDPDITIPLFVDVTPVE